jgi:hypothetical protein
MTGAADRDDPAGGVALPTRTERGSLRDVRPYPAPQSVGLIVDDGPEPRGGVHG